MGSFGKDQQHIYIKLYPTVCSNIVWNYETVKTAILVFVWYETRDMYLNSLYSQLIIIITVTQIAITTTQCHSVAGLLQLCTTTPLSPPCGASVSTQRTPRTLTPAQSTSRCTAQKYCTAKDIYNKERSLAAVQWGVCKQEPREWHERLSSWTGTCAGRLGPCRLENSRWLCEVCSGIWLRGKFEVCQYLCGICGISWNAL